jgi:DNA-binding CsgD family transcriptional regulator
VAGDDPSGPRWPFVGRRRELVDLRTHLLAGRSVLLAGPAGVGKSRLAQAAAPKACRLLATVAAAESPLGALAPLLGGEVPTANLLGWAGSSVAERVGGRVLLVDDAHLLDAASAEVLQQLVTANRIQLVATVRAGLTVPEPLQALWRQDSLRRLEVAELPGEAVRELLARVRADTSANDRERIARLAGGNLLYLRELARTPTFELSPQLVELIESHVGGLDVDARRGLELLALAEPLPLAVWLECVPALVADRLETRALVTVSGEPEHPAAQLGHPLYGEVIRATCTQVRRRERYRQLVAAAHHVAVSGPEYATRVALWHLESDTPAGVERLFLAMQIAWAAHDYTLARRLGQAALDEGGGPDVVAVLAAVLHYAGESSEAENLIDRTWPSSCSDKTRALLAATWINALVALGRMREAQGVLADALHRIADERAGAELRFWQASLHLSRLELPEMAATINRILSAPVSPAMRAQARMLRAWQTVYTGRPTDAAAEVTDIMASRPAWQRDVPVIIRALYHIRLLAARFAGDMNASRAVLDSMTAEQVAEQNWTQWTHELQFCRGSHLLWAGNVDAALPLLQHSAAAAPEQRALMAGELAYAYGLSGDAHAASEVLASVSQHSTEGLARGVCAAARPWIAAARGDHEAAQTEALTVADELATMGLITLEVQVRHDVVRFGGAAQVRERLGELAQRCQGEFAGWASAHASATSPQQLERVAAAFASGGLLLHAADAAADAATAYAAQSDRRAEVAAAAAMAYAAQCGGARTPALGRVKAPRLTDREWQIVRLAAAGATNRAIADRMVLSVRTVENHLHAAYHKLGVSQRGELARLLGVSNAEERLLPGSSG